MKSVKEKLAEMPQVVRTACDFKAHARAVVKYKHHYYTAAGISFGFALIGFLEPHWHIAHWMYAVMETFTSGGDK